MAYSTEIIAEPGKQELFVIREFDAPRELVYQAFTDPDLLLQFFAPDGVNMQFDYCDYREKGSYRFIHTNAAGKVLCIFKGVIHEMSAPERFIQTAEMEGLPERGHVVLEAMHFEALPNGRTKLIIHDVCLSIADRDAMVQSGMESGLVIIFKRLDLLLAKQLV